MFDYGIIKYLILSVPELMILTQILLKLNDPDFTIFKKKIILLLFIFGAINFMASGQTSVSVVLSAGSFLLSILYSFNFYKIDTNKIVFSMIFIFVYKTVLVFIYSCGYLYLIKKDLYIMDEVEYTVNMVYIEIIYLIGLLHYSYLKKFYDKLFEIYINIKWW